MPGRRSDQYHRHRSPDMPVRLEYAEEGRLHRHRVDGEGLTNHYTTWAHNTPSHQHRLPDGSFARPREDLTPPAIVPQL